MPSSDGPSFIAYFSDQMEDSEKEEILRCRRWIAQILGVSNDKLRPNQTLGFLVDRFDYFGDLMIGLNDLRDELEELSAEVGEVAPRVERETTVAEIVETLRQLEAKRRERKKGTNP
jgi:hypothetical protein